jgi:CubicO group peptidase (beta-lactamase class C family)
MGLDSVMRSRLFEPAGMPLSTFSWNPEIARLSVYGHQEETKPAVHYKREMGDRFLSLSSKWGKPLSAWTYEDVLRALPEARMLPGPRPLPEKLAKAPLDTLKLPDNLFPNVAGSLSTTVSEYAKFMTLVMDRRQRASWEITDVNRRAMLSRQMMRKANAIYWGLGWALESSPSNVVFYHSGNNGNRFKTLGVGDPIHRRALVVFTNGGNGDRVYQRIVRAATGYDLLEFLL